MSFYLYLYCTYAKRMVLLTDHVPRAGTRTFSPEEARLKRKYYGRKKEQVPGGAFSRPRVGVIARAG